MLHDRAEIKKQQLHLRSNPDNSSNFVIEEWDESSNHLLMQYGFGQKINEESQKGPQRILPWKQAIEILIRKIFIPSGYPESIPPEYITFQKWNLIQDFCSHLRNIMMTKAILTGIGVGRADVTAASATVLWILRDGASLIGGLIFSAVNSTNFGHNVKTWRLFADFINNIGITLNMIAPLFPNWFLPLICIGSICTSLCGIAAGATGGAITSHWGSRGSNVAEVLTKNGAQHTVLSLVGLAISIPFTTFADRLSPMYTWFIYGLLTIVHMMSNYRAMRVLALTSLNVSRYHMLLDTYIGQCGQLFHSDATKSLQLDVKIDVDDLLEQFRPATIAAKEPILSLFCTSQAVVHSKRVQRWARIPSQHINSTAINSNVAVDMLSDNFFVFVPNDSDKYALCFKHGVSFHDQAHAYFTAYLLDLYPSMKLPEAQKWTDKLFPAFWENLLQSGWLPNCSSLQSERVITYRVTSSNTLKDN